MSTPASERAVSPAPGAAAADELRRLYREAASAEASPEREQYVSRLKHFLAEAEAHAGILGPLGDEFGPILDETAMALYRAGQPALARHAVDLGLSLQPGSVALLHHKALVLLAQNDDLPQVVTLVERALVANPRDRSLWATKGDALRLLNRPNEAAEAYLRAQELETGSMQFVDRALKLVPDNPAALRMKIGLAQSLGGEAGALEAADELLKASPNDAGLRGARARLLAALGRPADALAALDAARSAGFADPDAPLLRLRILFDLGRDAEGSVTAKEMLERNPPPGTEALAEIARLTTDRAPEVSLRARERLAESDPRNLQNLQALRALAVRLDEPGIALAACRTLLQIQPDHLEALGGVAEFEAVAGRPDAALEAYRTLARVHPQAVAEMRRALELSRRLGREADVRAFATAILAEEPGDVPAQLELARALAAEGNAPGALAIYDALLAAHPGQLPYLLEKRQVLSQSPDPGQLAPVLDELFRLDPTRTDVAVERGNLALALAYAEPEHSDARDRAARTALVSYERASSDPDAAAVAELGIARASRLVGDLERAVRSYRSFLDRAGNTARNDVRKELAQALQESGRFTAALELYFGALGGGSEDPEIRWGAVEVLDHLNDDRRALQLLEGLLRQDPQNPLYLRRLGQILLRAGRRDQAMQALQRAVAGAEGDSHPFFEVAEALRVQGAYADAVDYFKRGLAVDPKNRHGRVALAETLVLAGQHSESIQITDPLLKEDPNDVAAWKVRADAWRALGRPAEVLYSLKAILLLEPEDPTSLLEKYRLHHDAGESRDAFEALTRLLGTAAPEAHDANLHLERGDLAARLGLTEEASRSYERAAEIDPALLPEIAMRRARLRLAAGRPDLALEVLEHGPAGTAPPEATTGLLLLRAEILTALERPSEARAAYEEALARDPKSPVALAGVGRTLIDEGRHAEAADYLRRALAKGPPHEPAYLLLAEAESGTGHLERAEEVLLQGTAALPKGAALWARLGEVGIARQNWNGAATAYQHALALTPTAVPTLMRAGFVAERQEHPNEALAFYERATESEPQNPQAWTSRGLALLATGRPQEAATSFDRALALDSDFAAAKDGRKLAVEKTRDQQVQRYGREALLLEARLHRPLTKNDLFVTLHVPFEFLEPVLAAIGQNPPIALDRLSAEEVHELENGSYHLITAALERRPPGIEHRGLTLADVAVLSPPSASLEQLARLFGYLRAVLEADLRAENLELAPDVQELARRALVLPPEQRSLFQLVRTLRVGIYKARLIKVVEEAGTTVRAPLPTLDLAAYGPEFRASATPSDEGPAEGADHDGERFFAPEIAPAASAGAPPPQGTPPGAASPAGSRSAGAGTSPGVARCVACGGIASVRHACGATLCQHCIGQFPRCPKCGDPVGPTSAAALGGTPATAPPGASPPAQSGHAPGALRSVFGRGKEKLGGKATPGAAPPARPVVPAHGHGPNGPAAAPSAGKATGPTGVPGPTGSRAASSPPKASAPAGSAPSGKEAKAPTKAVPEPPAPPTAGARSRRDKADDEPRL